MVKTDQIDSEKGGVGEPPLKGGGGDSEVAIDVSRIYTSPYLLPCGLIPAHPLLPSSLVGYPKCGYRGHSDHPRLWHHEGFSTPPGGGMLPN
eukprot:6812538-Heterocapsa_arctica.AAC.1